MSIIVISLSIIILAWLIHYFIDVWMYVEKLRIMSEITNWNFQECSFAHNTFICQ